VTDTTVVRVYLLDDHEVVRRGVRELLEAEPDMKIVGEASTAEEALNSIALGCPHVALLDVQLPDGNGVDVCREIRSRDPEIRCIILTSFSDSEALRRAVFAGASGYLLKQMRGTDVVDAIRRIAAGQSLLDPAAAEELLEQFRRHAETDDRLELLSRQQRRILTLIAEGLTNRQIAERMNLAETTVRNYVSSLLTKLGMARRTQAAVFASRLDGGSRGRPRPSP
jgi:DNA-binding NarL/FixJ family response regulator